MRVRLLLFGVLKELLPDTGDSLDVPPGSTVGEMLERWTEEAGLNDDTLGDTLGRVRASLAVAVNREYASRDRVLADGDEVALLPPVSGGQDPENEDQPDVVALTLDPIDAAPLIASVKSSADGAVTVFDGIVRDNTRGRRTLYLHYEAYDAMALEQMRRLAAEARTRFAVHRIALVHRLGRLAIGETSVLIAVASAHRGAAFEACRWLIDTLKKTVPVWKKEFFEDGAVWSDGEPFPPEIALAPPGVPGKE